MNQYTQVIQDIRKKTENNLLNWNHVPIKEYERFIVNVHRVVFAFSANYKLGDKEYRLLFLEKKWENMDDFSFPDNGIEYELFVLDDEDIVVSFVEGVVDPAELIRLSGAVKEKNAKSKAFFKSFLERESA